MTKTIKVIYTAHADIHSDIEEHVAVFQVSDEVCEVLTDSKFSPFPCYFNFPYGRKQAKLCQMVCAYANMHGYYILKSDHIISVVED